MLNVNPEFQRNAWIELTPYKLITTPLVMIALLYLGYLTGDDISTVMRWAVGLFTLLTIVYGAYLAGDSLADEVQEHTWPLQRLTALSPWTLTWGKILGGTLFAWYMGIWCLLAIIIAPWLSNNVDSELILHAQPGLSILYLIGIAALFHTAAVLASITQLEKTHSLIKRTIFVPIIALMLASMYAPFVLQKLPAEGTNVYWYFLSIPAFLFATASIYLHLAWFLCAAYMLMRTELQFVNTIWVWLAFLSFESLYWIGFTFAPSLDRFSPFALYDAQLQLPLMSVRLGIVFVLCYFFAYVMAAVENINVIEIRNALRSKIAGHLTLISNILPRWVPTFLLTLLFGIALLISIAVETELDSKIVTLVFALIAFMLRDIGLFVFFDLAGKKRHVTTAAVYLFLLYVIIPTILKLLHLSFLLTIFYPRPDYPFIYALAAPIIQAAVVWRLVVYRFKSMTYA